MQTFHIIPGRCCTLAMLCQAVPSCHLLNKPEPFPWRIYIYIYMHLYDHIFCEKYRGQKWLGDEKRSCWCRWVTRPYRDTEPQVLAVIAHSELKDQEGSVFGPITTYSESLWSSSAIKSNPNVAKNALFIGGAAAELRQNLLVKDQSRSSKGAEIHTKPANTTIQWCPTFFNFHWKNSLNSTESSFWQSYPSLAGITNRLESSF